MCFDYEALPPEIPPALLAAGGAAPTGEIITLTSADGTPFAAYRARPTAPNGAGIVILPDVRGLYRFYEELALRFASIGVEAITIDYFGRTAGNSERDGEFDYMPHVMQTQADNISQDVQVAITQLRESSGANLKAIFTVGFCFGGSNSLAQAANGHGLSGVIAFYGSPTRARSGNPAPIDRINEFRCPVLGLYGGADQGIPQEDLDTFDAALTNVGISHEIIVYPGAPHSFFDRTGEQHQQESADAWQHILSFIHDNTPHSSI